MASVESLRRQVAALREKIPLKHDPKQWVFHLTEGEEIPAAISARFNPADKVFIHCVVAGYDHDEGPCIGWVTALTGKGPVEILYREDYQPS